MKIAVRIISLFQLSVNLLIIPYVVASVNADSYSRGQNGIEGMRKFELFLKFKTQGRIISNQNLTMEKY